VKILVTGELETNGLKLLEENNFKVVEKKGIGRKELLGIIPDFNALLTRSETIVDKELLDRAKNLKLVGRGGVGIDNIDLGTASEKGIIIMNTPDANTISAVEHTMALLLGICRAIPEANKSLKNGEWERKKFTGFELYKKTIGIIGLGRIGSRIAKRCKSFEMNVLAYDPYIPEETAWKAGVVLVDDLKEMLSQCDILSIHAPLTSETKGMIGKEEISRLKDNAVIVNCARGGLVDENALLEALETGKLYGAALDVFKDEPPKDSKLVKHSRTIVTPHLGANTVESQKKVSIQLAEQVADALLEKSYKNVVNLPFEGEDFIKIKPFLDLAEAMGRIQSQVSRGSKTIEIEARGEMEGRIKLVTVAFLKGFLSGISDSVNYVNAPLIASKHGLKIKQLKSFGEEDFTNLVLTRTNVKEESVLKGTLFDGKNPRIVQLNSFRTDFVPEGNILLMENYDRPGVIGAVGTLLGENRINIGEWHLGRKEKGDKALAIINLDSAVPVQVMEKLKKLDNIISVRQILL